VIGDEWETPIRDRLRGTGRSQESEEAGISMTEQNRLCGRNPASISHALELARPAAAAAGEGKTKNKSQSKDVRPIPGETGTDVPAIVAFWVEGCDGA
jgi:hypothetical protein